MTKKTKIIVAEDEIVIAMDLCESLTRYGYDVVAHVTCGEDVFKAIEKCWPDIIIMDIKLEGPMDGVDIAEIIHENYNIPVIFLTSYSNNKLIERAKKTNPFGYIVKPYEDKDLFTTIEIAIFKHTTEVKLKESEKKYRELSESIQQIIIECSLNGRINYINQPGMQLLGLSYSEIEHGISLSSFIEDADFKNISNRIINHSHSDLQNVNREYRLLNKLGKHYFVEEYLSPIYILDKIAGFRGILIDITSKRLKEHLNLLFNTLTFRYSTSSVDPFILVGNILKEFEKKFAYFECIYFNEYDEANRSFHKHEKNICTSRPYDKGYSEYVVETKRSLYLRGQDLANFIKQYDIPGLGQKPACWSGFAIKFHNRVLGVFALKSFTNENALTLSEFDNLCVFFDNINALLERISYLREIKGSEEQYKLLVNSINDGIVQVDLAGNIIFVNRQISVMTDYTADELLSMKITDLLGTTPKSMFFLDNINRDNVEWKEFRHELKIASRKGVLKDFLVNGSPVKNGEGKTIASMATFIDVTERKEHLKLIRESEQLFSEMAKNVPGAIFQFRVKESGTVYVSYISEKITELFGIEINKDITFADLGEMIPEEEQEGLFLSIDTALKKISEWKYEGRIICGNGEIKWFEGKSTPVKIGDEYVFNGILIDITIRKQALQAILKSEKEKDMILHSIPDSFLVINKYGSILNSYLKRNEQVISKTVGSLIGTNINNLNSNISNAVLHNLEICLQREKIIFDEIEILVEKKTLWFEMRMVPFSKDSVLIILRNVTEIRSNIFALQKFFNITEQSNELIMITDNKGNIEYVNPTFTKVTGYRLSQAKGKTPSFLKSIKHQKNFYTKMWETILSGQVFRSAFYNTRKDGELYIEEKTISPLKNEAGEITHFISTGRDVTEERKREKKIIIYQKFEKTLEKKEQKYRTLSLIQGEENERKRISREIHDGLGQMLTVAKANLAALDENTLGNPENAARIEFVNQIVSEIIQESRRISHNLSPVGLYEFGLHAILMQLVKRIGLNFENLQVTLESNTEKLRFKNEIEINLYRIAQEVVQNSLKHSQATKIMLTLHLENNVLTLTITDNGVGFNVNQLVNDNKHFNGIKNIEERVKIIDGKLSYLAQKNEGVSVHVSLKAKLINP